MNFTIEAMITTYNEYYLNNLSVNNLNVNYYESEVLSMFLDDDYHCKSFSPL